MYFGIGATSGSRFQTFLDMTEEATEALQSIISKRYTRKALLALALEPLVDNNNVERLWTRVVKWSCGKRLNTTQGGTARCNLHMAILENNDGYGWLQELDKLNGLEPLAQASRLALGRKRERDRDRKRSEASIARRKMRRQRADFRQGKITGGWKQGTPPMHAVATSFAVQANVRT